MPRTVRRRPLPAIRHSIWIDAAPARVWRALTAPREVGRWFTTAKKLEPRRGGRWDFVGFPGELLEWKRGRRLAHSHVFSPRDPVSRIAYEIVPSPSQRFVELVVVHDRFGGSRMLRGCWDGSWPFVLSNLKSFVERGKPMAETAFRGSDG